MTRIIAKLTLLFIGLFTTIAGTIKCLDNSFLNLTEGAIILLIATAALTAFLITSKK